MIDPELERRAADCTELMDTWRQFLDMANRALKPPKTTTPQLEQQFLMNKARIAMLHDSFMSSLKHDRQVGQNMIEIVNRAITLRGLAKITEAEVKKLELEWHECFLLLNETITSLNEDRERLAAINEFSHNMKKMREKFFLNVKAILCSFYFKLVAFPAVLVIVLWAIHMFFYDFDKIRRIGFLNNTVYTTYHQVKRGMGFDGKYAEFKQFKDKINAEPGKIPTISVINMQSDKTKQDQVFDRWKNTFDPTTLDHFRRNQGYELVYYATQGEKEKAWMYVFYFYDIKEALPIENYAKTNAARLGNQQVYRKSNVIIVLQCSDQTLRERLVADVIDKF